MHLALVIVGQRMTPYELPCMLCVNGSASAPSGYSRAFC